MHYLQVTPFVLFFFLSMLRDLQKEKLNEQYTGYSALLRNGHNPRLLHSVKNPSALRKTLKHRNGNGLKGRSEGSAAAQLPGLGHADVPESKAPPFFHGFASNRSALQSLTQNFSPTLFMDRALQGSGCLHSQSCEAPDLLSLPSGTYGSAAGSLFEAGSIRGHVWL